MSDDIRVGDRFLVEVEVVDVAPEGDKQIRFDGLDDYYDCEVPDRTLRAAKRLPRQIKPGDKVRLKPESVADYCERDDWSPDDASEAWTVLALDSFDPQGAALVRGFGATMFRRDWAEVDDLALVESSP